MNLFGGRNTLEKKARNMTDCNYVMNKFLLEQYFFYRYRELFSFVVAALVVPAFLQYFRLKDGSYFRTYLFLFVIWYIVKMLISTVIKQLIPSDALHKLLTRCEGWQTDPKTAENCKAVIDPKLASQYLKETFDNQKPAAPTIAVVEDEEEKDVKDNLGKPVSTGVSAAKNTEPAASNEVSESFSNPMLTGTPVCKNLYAPINSKCAPGCMKDDNMRKMACLGLEPTSNINYPGAGAYQVQSAATVQNRLVNNNYVPGNCLDLLQG